MKQKLIALMLVLCSVGALLVPQVMAEEKPVSRIEWVRQLVKAFDMTVEEDNYPDNYYSDMEETSVSLIWRPDQHLNPTSPLPANLQPTR